MRGLPKIKVTALGRGHALGSPVCRVCRGFMTYTRLLRKTYPPPFTPSLEQERIAEASSTMNVVVSALPGSGKTATIWAIIKANPNARILTIVYSRQLREEMRERFEEYPQCEFHTLHQTAQILFGKPVPDDATLWSIRRSCNPLQWTRQLPDIIISDEIQDSYPLLFWLQCLLLGSIKNITDRLDLKAPRWIALGDERQEINSFRGADSRYLSLCVSTMRSLSPYRWKSLALTKSFRLSYETCTFINHTFLGGEESLIGSRTGPKPIYLHADITKVEELGEVLAPLIRLHGPENTAILTPFTRNNYKLPLLTNHLSKKYRFPVFVQSSDDAEMNNDVIRGKICVATYHRFKGNERDLVVVVGADEMYFKYLGRDLLRNVLPNTVFVACTRARKQLVMIHDSSQGPMPCTRLTQLYKTAEYINLAGTEMKKCSEVDEKHSRIPARVAAAHLARHVPDEILKSISDKHLDIIQMAEPGHDIHVPDKVLTNKTKRYFEAVNDLNGNAVIAAYEYEVCRSLVSLGYDPSKRPIIPIDRDERAAWFCKMACEYDARICKYRSRRIQMARHSFDWLDGGHLEKVNKRLTGQLQVTPKPSNFEVRLSWKGCKIMESSGETAKTNLHGSADIITNKEKQTNIWEFKFKSTGLSLCDGIQTAIYGYLWHVSNLTREHQEPPNMYLYNVRTGEKREVIAKGGIAGLADLIKQLLKVKYFPRAKPTDAQFLKDCTKTAQEVQEVLCKGDVAHKGPT